MSNSILTRTFQNTFFLGAYATLANLPNVAEKLPRYSMDDLRGLTLSSFTSAPQTMASFAKRHIVSGWEGATLDNAKWLGSSLLNKTIEQGISIEKGLRKIESPIAESLSPQSQKGLLSTFGTKVSNFVWRTGTVATIEESLPLQPPNSLFTTVTTTLSTHSVEIGTCVAIAASATLLDGLFKTKMPLLKNHPYLRLPISVAAASTAIYYGANILTDKVDTQMLLDIGIKVGAIGLAAKLATSTIPVASTIVRELLNLVNWGCGGICKGVSAIAGGLNYGSLPTTVKADKIRAKKEKELKQNEEKQSAEYLFQLALNKNTLSHFSGYPSYLQEAALISELKKAGYTVTKDKPKNE